MASALDIASRSSFGETVVSRDALEFRVPVLGPSGVGEAPRALEFDYQGYADAA